MRIRPSRLAAPIICLAAFLTATKVYKFIWTPGTLAQRESLREISRHYPNFSAEQRTAVLRERMSELHPKWRDLSVAQIARLVVHLLTTPPSPSSAPLAPFYGNLTTFNAPSGTILGLEREADCSLTLGYSTYTLNLPSVSYAITPSQYHFDQTLHTNAGLTTTGGNFPSGCGDPLLGITARTIVPVGVTTGNVRVVAAAGYNGVLGENTVFTVAIKGYQASNETVDVVTLSGESPSFVAAADFNGDGNNDLAVLSNSMSVGGSAAVSIFLGNADGSFQDPVTYTLPGNAGVSMVLDDFNGDGKPDIIAASAEQSSTSTTYDLTYFQGKGDGTFLPPQSVVVTPPAGFSGLLSNAYTGLISTDLLGNGKKDLVTGTGIVLMGNGDGTFDQSSTLAFPPSIYAEDTPNVVAADFNNDGKMDLAVDTTSEIAIFLGTGSGTFTPGPTYATTANYGYLNAADLDGDGNVDLYSGIARGGRYGGDQWETGQGYALMGKGNGTFAAAPELPYALTGTNYADLNGDKIPDEVGVNSTLNSSNVSFSSYLGKSDGTFTVGSTLTVSPITLNGTTYSFTSLDSYGLGDVNGDGYDDLVYLPQDLAESPYGPLGFFIATGNGDGSFNTPVFYPIPSFVPAGGIDFNPGLTGIWVKDVNGDGKADVIYSYYDEDYTTSTFYEGIAVQLSNGDGTFQAPKVIQIFSGAALPAGNLPIVTEIGDVVGNGIPDLLVVKSSYASGVDTTQLQLYLGKGDGTFGAASTPPVADNISPPAFGELSGQIAIADMNGDGKPDLITLGTTNDQSQGELAISLGNGDGTFQTPTILDFGSGSSVGYSLAVADFNGDGKPDVAVGGFDPPIDTGIFLGNGDGTLQSFTAGGLTEPAEAINFVGYGAAAAVDINGDGLPDLVLGSVALINLGTAPAALTTTTTALTASAATAAVGQNITFTATVTASTTPSGTVTFYDSGTAIGTGTLNGSGVATYSTSSLAVGNHSITATYAGNSTFAASTSSAVPVTISSAPLTATTTELTASASTVNTGTSVTFTADVTPSSGTGTPTGTVSFMNGGTVLGTGTLGSGQAAYSTSSLAAGSYSVTAVYGGDTNFAGSTSAAVALTVQTVSPSFSVGDSPASATVSAGQSAQTTITITPANGFNQQVSLACSGLPTGGSCTFNPTTVTPSGAAASTTLSIATPAQSAVLARPLRPGSRSNSRGGLALAMLAGGALWFLRRKRRGASGSWLSLGLICCLAIVAAAVGCGGGGSSSTSKTQTYTVTVTATAGSETQTTNFALTVD